MNKRILRRVAGIIMAGTATFALSACAPMAGGNPDYYSSPDQNNYVMFPEGSPDEVRYAITRDMYMQGYYLAYDDNPLVFERPVPGSPDLERVTFWLSPGEDGVQVTVDQIYLIYADNGWRESRDWNNPYRPLFMPRYLHDFREEFYRHPRDYWDRERDRDRDRDWSRGDERQRWEREENRGGRMPPLPPIERHPPRLERQLERQQQRQPMQQPMQQPQPAERQQQMRDMRERWQQQHPQQPGEAPRLQQELPPQTQQQHELQDRWRQQHPQIPGQSPEQQPLTPQSPQMREFQDRWRQQHQVQPGAAPQQQQREAPAQPESAPQITPQQQQFRQMMERRQQQQQQQQQQQPAVTPQGRQWQPAPQPQPRAQPAPQPPAQQKNDDRRERFKGQQPN